jgi:flagellar biosynthesis protein FlgN
MAISIDRLKTLLKEDLNDLTHLNEILQKERSALKKRSTDSIQQISSEKSSSLKSIEYRAKQKARLFVEAGYSIKAGAFEKAVMETNDTELNTLWKTVNQALKHCKEQNTVNGTVVSHSLKRVNKLMSIIRGQNNKPNLYGASGREHAMGGMNSIAKA